MDQSEQTCCRSLTWDLRRNSSQNQEVLLGTAGFYSHCGFVGVDTTPANKCPSMLFRPCSRRRLRCGSACWGRKSPSTTGASSSRSKTTPGRARGRSHSVSMETQRPLLERRPTWPGPSSSRSSFPARVRPLGSASAPPAPPHSSSSPPSEQSGGRSGEQEEQEDVRRSGRAGAPPACCSPSW